MNLERSIDREKSQRIRNAIKHVLMSRWDPIGVKNEPMAADEYDMYVGCIYGLLLNRSQASAISNQLREIEIKRMGFSEDQVPQHLDIAESLLQIPLD